MFYKQWFKQMLMFPVFLILAFLASVSGQSAPNTQLEFNISPRHQIGLNTIQTEYADLDGDGFLDIAAVNGGQDNPNPMVTILFGDGQGGFSPPLVMPSYLIGHTITSGDLNNDGMSDLVIAGWYQNGIGVFLNQGNRQFSAPVFSIPPDPPYPGLLVGEFFDLAIADFDGDGNNDVVALQDQIDQRLRFFHFSGQGSLTVFATLDQIGQNTSYEREMAVGDINGDSRPDVVLSGGGPFGNRHTSFVFGQPAGGTLSMTYGFSVEDKAVGISIKDLDNDGDNDMAFAFLDMTTPTRHSLQVFRNNGSGNFIALPKIFLEYPFPPDDITTNDFNNDGVLDIAALIGSVYNNGVMIMVTNGTGDGTFAGEKYYAVSGSASLFSADLNQDGRTDLLTASSFGLRTDIIPYNGESNNTVNVLFNNNLQGFKAPSVKLWGSDLIDAGDFNRDGYKDLVTTWTSYYSSNIEILINDTHGGIFFGSYQPSPTFLKGMKTGDFNGDGKWDVVSVHQDNNRAFALYLGNGDGTIGEPITTQFNSSLVKIIVGDFNSDGRDDVFAIDDAARGYSMLSNSNGTFSIAPGSPITLPSNVPFELQKGDFNRDNTIDLVITMNSEVKLWLGNGAGQFAQSSVAIPQLISPVPGDFNGDGKIDLVGRTGPPAGGIGYITGVLGDGNGGFTDSFSRQIGNFSFNITQSIVTADFDLDGFDDVAMIMKDNTFGNLIVIPSGGSSPSWKQPIFYGVGTATRTLIATDFNADGKPDLGYLGDNSRGIIYNTTAAPRRPSFDFDGDGKSDVSVFRPSNGAWYLQQSTSGFTGVTFGLGTDDLTPADFDGDGKTDVAVFRNGVWYYLKSSNNTFVGVSFGQNGDLPRPADYDGDGKADINVFRPSTGAWYRLNSSNNSFYGVAFGQNGDKPLIADFDGDGKSDVAVFRPSTGSFYSLDSSNGAFRGAVFGFGTDIPTTGDFDGDGKTDVAVFRPLNGAWYRLNSSTGAFVGTIFGQNGDIPVTGDYDGDGKSDIAVFRPSNGAWYYLNSSSGGFVGVSFGTGTDKPIPAAFQ